MIDLQALDRGEDVDGAPVAAGAVVIEDQHQTDLLALALLGAPCTSLARVLLAELGPVARDVLPDARCMPVADAVEEAPHRVEARLVGERGVDDLRQRAGAGRPISGRAEIRLVK